MTYFSTFFAAYIYTHKSEFLPKKCMYVIKWLQSRIFAQCVKIYCLWTIYRYLLSEVPKGVWFSFRMNLWLLRVSTRCFYLVRLRVFFPCRITRWRTIVFLYIVWNIIFFWYLEEKKKKGSLCFVVAVNGFNWFGIVAWSSSYYLLYYLFGKFIEIDEDSSTCIGGPIL